MEWLLVAVIETQVVQTNLTFDSLESCLAADNLIRQAHADAFNFWLERAPNNLERSFYPESKAFMEKRIGITTYYTCIPFAEPGAGHEVVP